MKKRTYTLKLATLLVVLVFAVSCSDLSSPTASNPTIENAGNNFYAPIEETIAAIENQGLRALNYAVTALDDNCDSMLAERFARPHQGGSLNLQGIVRLEWLPGTLPNEMVLQIVSPARCIGVADFYPHPTHFNGYLNIVWDIRALNLPSDYNYDNLVPLYVHDDGTVEEVQYQWRGGRNELVVQTNHFSRYVITQRVDS